MLGPHRHAVQRRAGPVDLAIVTQPVQQPMMQLLPHAGLLPSTQPSPAGDPAAAAQRLGGQQPPGGAGAQDIDQPAQDRPVGDPRTAAFGLGWMGWQQRRDRVPDLVRDELLGHRRGVGVGFMPEASHPISLL